MLGSQEGDGAEVSSGKCASGDQKVEGGERDRRRFLQARESPERPFAVILGNLLLLSHGNIGDEMYAVVAEVVVT